MKSDRAINANNAAAARANKDASAAIARKAAANDKALSAKRLSEFHFGNAENKKNSFGRLRSRFLGFINENYLIH